MTYPDGGAGYRPPVRESDEPEPEPDHRPVDDE